MEIKDNEKLMNDLINTFKDRDDIDNKYKEKMKQIISKAILAHTHFLIFYQIENVPTAMNHLDEWVDNYVERGVKINEEDDN